jgi:hypothetical protein
MFREITKCIDSCSSYLGCTMIETFRNEDIHYRILKIFFYFLCTTLTNSSKNQETCIHFIHLVRVNESYSCLKKNRVDLFRFNSNSQCLDEPESYLLYKLSYFSFIVFSVMVRFTAREAGTLNNFFEERIS